MPVLEDLVARRAAFGMRLGTARMRRLLARLGDPQRQLRVVHVVGTNGKSSTTRFCAAALTAQGLRAGAYLSPHVTDLAERVELDGARLDPAVLAAAADRVAAAAAAHDAAAPDDPLTQFEVLTAAAFTALAGAGAEVGAIEAGLGGRHDATNVLDAPVVVLTSVGLDHTEHLGPTLEAVAGEKVAVVTPGAHLLTGPLPPGLDAHVRALAEAAGAAAVTAPPPLDAGVPLRAAGRFQRANAALALAAARLLAGEGWDEGAARAAVARVRVPGRMELRPGPPPLLLDGAHNPDGARALAAELDDALGARRPRVGVVAVLADKDVDGILAAVVPALDHVVATRTPSDRALAAADLAGRAAALGRPAEAVEPPAAALARARALAGTDGAVVAWGSLTLVAALVEDGRGA